MIFGKTTEHSIRAILWIALGQKERYSVRELSMELDIPYKYLGRLMPRLAKAGLLNVQRGKDGGYCLNRPVKDIYLFHIVETIEGLEILDKCVLGFTECSDDKPCPVHSYWGPIREKYREMLYNVSLADIHKNEFIKL